jgi:hypothetical protein
MSIEQQLYNEYQLREICRLIGPNLDKSKLDGHFVAVPMAGFVDLVATGYIHIPQEQREYFLYCQQFWQEAIKQQNCHTVLTTMGMVPDKPEMDFQ